MLPAVCTITLATVPALLAPAAPPVPEGYVPDAQCALCHRALSERYQHVGMARSLARPGRETIIEDFQRNHFYHASSRRHYQMTVLEDGRYAMHRYQVDQMQERYNELTQPIDWIIGSGFHSRGYLYQTDAGELFELPIAWYTQTQSWGMAPGYDRPDHEGIGRPITRACLFCHNAYPAAPAGSDRYGTPQVFGHELPQGTGCQRCHGPGAEHVRLANDLEVPLDDVVASIVNPARLPPRLRDDVCFQCHLQPTSKLTSLVRRFGRASYSYRPGEPLEDYLVHLDFDDGTPAAHRFEINHHPYRLRQSRCYVESDGALHCLSCHDPHRKVPPDEVSAHFRAACLACHAIDDCDVQAMAPASDPPGDCIACHMPKRRTQDVVGVVMTDHLIQRGPPNDVLAPLAETPPPQGARGAPYFPDRAPPDPVAALYLAIAAVADGNVGEIDALQEAIETVQPDAIEPVMELGAAQLKAGRVAEAAASFEKIVRREPELAVAWANLGTARSALGEGERAVEALERALALDPNLPEAHFNLAVTYARLGRAADALDAYRATVELRPHHAKAWLNLGNLLARAGDLDESIEAFGAALAAEPNLSPAYRSLGAAQRHLERWPEAIRTWERGLRASPDQASLQVELALARLIGPEPVTDLPRGLEHARSAAESAPQSARVQLTLALALLLNERHADALDAGLRAARHGADRATCTAIVALAQHGLGLDERSTQTWGHAAAMWSADPPGDRIARAVKARAEAIFGGQP